MTSYNGYMRTDGTRHNNMLVAEVDVARIASLCNELGHMHHLPLKTIAAIDDTGEDGSFKVFYIFGVPKENYFLAPYITLKDTLEFPSIASSIHAASVFERKIYSLFGLMPAGHPNLRPMILHENWPVGLYPLRKNFDIKTRPEWATGNYPFSTVEGEGIYEIPVGPVHAGIIEPGHFRFSVAGEEIMFLDPKLGYVHKGIEKLFETLPLDGALKLSERVSGDSSFSHSMAFCQAIEMLAGTRTSPAEEFLRIIFAELERLANHCNDIGFILNDTGFNFGGANGPRLREQIMQLNEQLTENRFLRNVNRFGGVTKDITPVLQENLRTRLGELRKDFTEVIAIACSSDSVLNRLKGTGILDARIAEDHGVVGVAARANGIETDARIDHPYASYEKITFEPATETSGDVYARFMIRVKEVSSSITLIEQAISMLSGRTTPISTEPGNLLLHPDSYAVGATEGWRGEIVYFVATDSQGNIKRVDVRDPSFLNWTVVPHAVKGNIVPDFPLINKSFNLSYSGNDV
jgi:Ni,Fe-hydrogenase III large subunit/Ni,Fe-hydrogenase III component G